MDVRDNSGVIRIPISDPREAKEGLLKFALPRQCLTEDCAAEPQFYPQDRVVRSEAHAATAAPRATAPAAAANDAFLAKLDEIVRDVADARQSLGEVSSQVDYTGFNIKRTRQDLYRMDFPLDTAQRDTAQVDSSREGQELDFKLWSARNSLSDTDRSGRQATIGGERVHERLDEATQKLQSLRNELGSTGVAGYAEVISLLDQAASALRSADKSSNTLSGYLVAGSGRVDRAHNELLSADGYVTDIKLDGPGKDVSRSAKRLRSLLDQAGGRLGEAAEQVSNAAPHVRTTQDAALRAEDFLFEARDLLG